MTQKKSKWQPIVTSITLLLGIALFVWLTLQQDSAKLYQAFLTVGWHGLLYVVAAHLFFPMVFSTQGWRVLLSHPPSFVLFYRARWIREAAKNLLPLMQLGGDAVGARVLVLGKVSTKDASIITIGDITTEAAALIPFSIVAIVLAVDIANGLNDPDMLQSAIGGGIVLVILTCAFLIMQKLGIFRFIENLLLSKFDTTIDLHDSLMTLYGDMRKSLTSTGWHCLGWLAGSLEIWIIFYVMGAPISYSEAILMEGLGQAIKSVTFFVPAGIGVQEGSFILIGSGLGLAPEIALAASLIRRCRHLIIGIPALIYWSRMEYDGKQS